MYNKYGKIFAIIKDINMKAGTSITYQELVYEFTDGETCSLSSLKEWQFKEFERQLMQKSPSKKMASQYKSDPLDKPRKAIISQFLSIGRSADEAKAWAEKYGVKGNKKAFNDYTGDELWLLVQNAEKVKRDFIKSASKKLQNGLQ